MEAIHYFGKLSLRKKAEDRSGFLITNKRGSYTYLNSTPSSRYEGAFFYDEENSRMFRVIENIELINQNRSLNQNRKPNHISLLKNRFYRFDRKNGNVGEQFLMPEGLNSLVYRTEKEAIPEMIMDVKDSFDNRQFGRNYSFSVHKNTFVVKFTKKTDSREDSTDGFEEYSIYTAVKCDGNYYEKTGRWIERNYSDDERRNSLPFSRFVYSALRMKGNNFVFSFGTDKEKAVRECNFVYQNIRKVESSEKKNFYRLSALGSVKKVFRCGRISKDAKMAYICCLNSLRSLKAKSGSSEGSRINFFAGLPWFFQFWSRDTLVALKSFSKIEQSSAEKIADFYLSSIQEDGRLQNILNKNNVLNSSDSIGWLFKRHSELKTSGKKLKESLPKSLYLLMKNHIKGGIYYNGKGETWMDTSYGNDNREGARIELQCMILNMHKLLYGITKDIKYKILENTCKEKVKELFWNGSILGDGANDFTIRPNVFIAYYFYPELLNAGEWIECFANITESLWLEWGGLSTIDKRHPLFVDFDTGEDSRSYHRGDSWFWINNLAALCINLAIKEYEDYCKINSGSKKNNAEKKHNAGAHVKKLRRYAEKLIEASTREILWSGAMGNHAEISDARQLSSRGCASQLWSAAMFVEMIDELASCR